MASMHSSQEPAQDMVASVAEVKACHDCRAKHKEARVDDNMRCVKQYLDKLKFQLAHRI